MPSDDPTPKRHGRLHFSLRTFLVAVTALCLLLGMYVKQKRDEHKAVEAAKRLGGVVRYAHFDEGEQVRRQFLIHEATLRGLPPPVFEDPSPSGPQWLRRLVGELYFARPVSVRINYNGLEKPNFQFLTSLTGLKSLTLYTPYIHDDDLARISCDSTLEGLTLSYTKITDEGLEHLQSLSNLKYLSLDGTCISDAGLRILRDFSELERLSIRDTQVTDTGVKEFRTSNPKCEISGPATWQTRRERILNNAEPN